MPSESLFVAASLDQMKKTVDTNNENVISSSLYTVRTRYSYTLYNMSSITNGEPFEQWIENWKFVNKKTELYTNRTCRNVRSGVHRFCQNASPS